MQSGNLLEAALITYLPDHNQRFNRASLLCATIKRKATGSLLVGINIRFYDQNKALP